MTEGEIRVFIEKSWHLIYQRACFLLRNRRGEAGAITAEVITQTWEHRGKLRRQSLLSWVLHRTHHLCLKKNRENMDDWQATMNPSQ